MFIKIEFEILGRYLNFQNRNLGGKRGIEINIDLHK